MAGSIISDFLVHTVQYRPRAGLDVTGEPEYGAARSIPARVEKRSRRTITPDGPLVDNYASVLVEEQISVHDEIDVGDGNGWQEVTGAEEYISSEGEFWGTECTL